MFNEAYTPRLVQKLMSRTPLGDIMSPLQGSSLARRMLDRTINELFGPDTNRRRACSNCSTRSSTTTTASG